MLMNKWDPTAGLPMRGKCKLMNIFTGWMFETSTAGVFRFLSVRVLRLFAGC